MQRSKQIVCGVAAALCVLAAGAAWAGAPDASLTGPTRGGLNLHLSFYPPTARSAALGTSTVALEGVDSHNPAALAFTKGFDLAYDYGRCSFGHGPDVDMHRGHLIVPIPKPVGGAMKLMGFNLSTRHTEMSRMGADTHVWAREFGFAYGREIPLPGKLPGQLGVGVGGFPSDPSELRLSAVGPDGKSRRIAHGRGISKLGSTRLGVLYQIDQFNVGAQYTHIKDDLWASYPGFGVARTSDKYYANLYTLGAAYRPDERTVLLVQHLTGRAQGDGVRADYDIFSLGAEREITDWLALRAGLLDGELTCGFGLKLPQDFRVDYAFMANYGHEVRQAFGEGGLHMIGIGKRF